jgi:hypothetical protein
MVDYDGSNICLDERAGWLDLDIDKDRLAQSVLEGMITRGYRQSLRMAPSNISGQGLFAATEYR